jgi:hypothetical protein
MCEIAAAHMITYNALNLPETNYDDNNNESHQKDKKQRFKCYIHYVTIK